VSVSFAETTPALPAADVERSIAFYRDQLGFEPVHAEEGFAVLRRDAATLHIWGATDESWHERSDWGRPVVSGAESFLAGTASCRVRVDGVDDLYAHCDERGIVHPNAHIDDTSWGTREFGVLDPDGNLIGFYEERAS
jgi:catechol 2,3-dioxygenase-like lactoylglutathione lyase family enzyme